ncbi:MAG: Kelch repeat-containing protein [Acidimicrobiales bacterium]
MGGRRARRAAAAFTVLVALLATPDPAAAAPGPVEVGPAEGLSATPAATMASARSAHAAVTLLNGKVLVVGGRIPGGFVDTAELYDPSSDTWSPAGAPGFGAWASATLLVDGRVLVAGGNHQLGPCPQHNCIDNKAAVYNPDTNTFSPAPPMNFQRSRHTATRLTDGRVLVAGGARDDFTSHVSAEVYVPATNSWVPTGPMLQGRASHTATLLPNGTVLVAGGDGNDVQGVATTELYDPGAGTWSSGPSMSAARSWATATTLGSGGRILVTGGEGDAFGNALASAELYDPAVNAWSAATSMAVSRVRHTATLLLDGTVLVTGGTVGGNSSVESLNSTERYRPSSNSWTSGPRMAVARQQHTASLLGSGDVLVAGGVPITATAERLGAPPLANPTVLEPGQAFSAGVHGLLSPNSSYRLKLGTGAETCHLSTTFLGGTVNADGSGDIAPVRRVLPSNLTSGERHLCWVRNGSTTDHSLPTEITIV